MSDPAAKEMPGFLPTLTEVVSLPPDVDVRIGRAPVAPAQGTLPPSGDAPGERMLQQLSGLLATRLHEVVDRLLQEQMRALAPRLRQEVELAVRQAVAQAVASQKRDQDQDQDQA